MRRLSSLEAWRHGRQLARDAYRLTMSGPLRTHYSLADQVRRAATSIPANIAEGYALSTTPQFMRCLRVALGSATELFTHLELAVDMELIPTQPGKAIVDSCDREIGLLIGLLRKLGS
ncbi:MAG TPA: four helix bundle protein [Gemmatimonadales bacterium]